MLLSKVILIFDILAQDTLMMMVSLRPSALYQYAGHVGTGHIGTRYPDDDGQS